jgi:hypothetical protein
MNMKTTGANIEHDDATDTYQVNLRASPKCLMINQMPIATIAGTAITPHPSN